jgi:hypothetical protein
MTKKMVFCGQGRRKEMDLEDLVDTGRFDR